MPNPLAEAIPSRQVSDPGQVVTSVIVPAPGSTVAEVIPSIEQARDWLAQAEALIYHKEYEQALRAAYEAAAAAARVPLYARLVDPFTPDEALWEFENLFVLSGQTAGEWQNLSSQFEALKASSADELAARKIVDLAKEFASYCTTFSLLEAA